MVHTENFEIYQNVKQINSPQMQQNNYMYD